jgi:hypothetical protein
MLKSDVELEMKLFVRFLRKFGLDERAQAAMEFLLVFPIFFLFLGLVIDFGVVMYQYVSISNAAREGARYAAVNCTNGTCSALSVCDWTIGKASGVVNDSHGDVKVKWQDRSSPADNNHGKGDSAIVNIAHSYSFIFVPGLSWTVASSADMRLEQNDGASSLPSSDATCS